MQPKVLSYHYKSKFEYAGAGGGFIDVLGYPFCRGRIFNDIEEDNGQYNDIKDVFWATGACFMVRTSIFKKFEGFDEQIRWPSGLSRLTVIERLPRLTAR